MAFVVAALAVPCLATDVDAQAVASVGNGSARINLLATATVGYRMNAASRRPHAWSRATPGRPRSNFR